MQIVLPLILTALVALMLLLPPLSFARAAGRFFRQSQLQVSYATRLLLTAGALLPLAINIGYMSVAWPDLSAGLLEPDQNLALAVLVSWLSFWGRVAVSRRTLRRRAHDL